MNARRGNDALHFTYGSVTTPLGRFRVVVGARGLVSLELKPGPLGSLRGRLEQAFGERISLVRDDRAPVLREIAEYATGKRRVFRVPVDLSLVSGFRRRVLEALRCVPYGSTVSYGELAALVGRPGAARAVGGAMASNPVALLVPCHRVLASGGRLGGFGGGLSLKRRLLALEAGPPVG